MQRGLLEQSFAPDDSMLGRTLRETRWLASWRMTPASSRVAQSCRTELRSAFKDDFVTQDTKNIMMFRRRCRRKPSFGGTCALGSSPFTGNALTRSIRLSIGLMRAGFGSY